MRLDPHSYADVGQPRTRSIDLALRVDFSRRTLEGEIALHFHASGGGKVDLDTRDLRIDAVTSLAGASLAYELAPAQPVLGSRLRVTLPAGAAGLRIRYGTSPAASALQWLEPAQTAGGQSFLFSQCQPIHARSLAPLQDTPRIRITIGSARFTVPSQLRTLMAAASKGREPSSDTEAVDVFEMPQPIPPYLLAFAVGDLTPRELSPRCAVCAERPMLEALCGRDVAELHAASGRHDLQTALDRFAARPELTRLRTDLEGVDPDEAYSSVPYEKGYLLLRKLEEVAGRPAWDRFLRAYLAKCRLQSITTDDFLQFLETQLPGLAARAGALEFIDRPGLPGDAPQARSARLEALRSGGAEPRNPTELLVVLQATAPDVTKLRELDSRWDLSRRKSLELRHTFVLLQLRAGMPEGVDGARRVLLEAGRRRYLRPTYTELARRDPAAAARISDDARAGYHHTARTLAEACFKDQS